MKKESNIENQKIPLGVVLLALFLGLFLVVLGILLENFDVIPHRDFNMIISIIFLFITIPLIIYRFSIKFKKSDTKKSIYALSFPPGLGNIKIGEKIKGILMIITFFIVFFASAILIKGFDFKYQKIGWIILGITIIFIYWSFKDLRNTLNKNPNRPNGRSI